MIEDKLFYELSDSIEHLGRLIGHIKPDTIPYTSTESHTLTYIEHHPGTTAKEIANNWVKTKGAISQILKKLYLEDLIYYEEDKADGKKKLIYLTAKGAEVSKKHYEYDCKTYRMFCDSVTTKLTEDEIKTSINFISEICRHLVDTIKEQKNQGL